MCYLGRPARQSRRAFLTLAALVGLCIACSTDKPHDGSNTDDSLSDDGVAGQGARDRWAEEHAQELAALCGARSPNDCGDDGRCYDIPGQRLDSERGCFEAMVPVFCFPAAFGCADMGWCQVDPEGQVWRVGACGARDSDGMPWPVARDPDGSRSSCGGPTCS